MLGCQVKNLSLAGQPPAPLMHHVFAASPAGAYGAAFPAQRPSVRTLIVHNSAPGSAGFRVRPAPGGLRLSRLRPAGGVPHFPPLRDARRYHASYLGWLAAP